MTPGEQLASSTVLGTGIRTFKPRRSRITARELAALSSYADFKLPFAREVLDFGGVWGDGIPVVMEIGFGSGSATATAAAARPDVGVLAVDIHTPGIGDLLDHLRQCALTNVRVIEADAIAVLEFMIARSALAGVRSYFPDPWPKPRHHKRRLIQPAVTALVASRIAEGSSWSLATDSTAYASHIVRVFDDDPLWFGGVVARPTDRPVTRYEQRAISQGRPVIDLQFTRR